MFLSLPLAFDRYARICSDMHHLFEICRSIFQMSSVVPWRATSYPSLHNSLCQSVCIFGGLSICLSQLYWSVHLNLTQSTLPVYLSILLGCIRITYEDISWYIKIQGRMLSNSSHLTLPLSLSSPMALCTKNLDLARAPTPSRSTAWRTADDKGKHGVFFLPTIRIHMIYHRLSLLVGYGHGAKCVNAWNGIAKIGAMIFVWPVLDTH